MPATRRSSKRVADEAPETNGRSPSKRTKSSENGKAVAVAEGSSNGSKPKTAKVDKGKKPALIQGQHLAQIKKSFRKDLFSDANVEKLRTFHEESGP